MLLTLRLKDIAQGFHTVALLMQDHYLEVRAIQIHLERLCLKGVVKLCMGEKLDDALSEPHLTIAHH